MMASSDADAAGNSPYQALSGDVNSDGVADILVRARSSAGPTLILLSGAGGAYTVIDKPATELSGRSVWQAGTHRVVAGDPGTAPASLMIKAEKIDATSFVLNMAGDTGTPRLVQQLHGAAIGIDLGAAGTTLAWRDQNGDGRADLRVSGNHRLKAVLLADAGGALHADAAATVTATWNAMLAALDAGDKATALRYISPGSNQNTARAFDQMGDAVRTFSATLSDFAIREVNPRYAMASITMHHNGEVTLRELTFIHWNDEWIIVEF